ncbi:MAG: hypothetical protein ABI347_04190 [Nitrososphaera sp.]
MAQQSGEKLLVQSSLLRFQNPEPSQAIVEAGQNVTFTGTIQSLISADMAISVSLKVNDTEGKDWNIIEKNPLVIVLISMPMIQSRMSLRFNFKGEEFFDRA